MQNTLQKLGIHPAAAATAIIADLMLFGPEAAPFAWPLTATVGLLITIPVFLLQKFAYKDRAAVAIAKAMLIGILTGIPTPLPAMITGIGGVIGFLGSLKKSASMPAEEKRQDGGKDAIDVKAEVVEDGKS